MNDKSRSTEGMAADARERRSTKVSVDPSLGEAKKLIQDALERSKAILVVGPCEIVYKGRASSTLGLGERLIIITEDKALLVHRSYGYRPVNWQPAGCKFRIEGSADRLDITAIRMSPLESVKMSFREIYLLCRFALIDDSRLNLYASELDMKKAILYRPALVEDGFKPITSEKEMPTGFADIFGRDKDGRYVVIEIKRGKATRDATHQLASYIEKMRKSTPGVRGILVGEGITKEARKSIISLGLEFKRLSPRKCSEILQEMERPSDKEITTFF